MSVTEIHSDRYKSTKSGIWTGRSVDALDGIQYWYQAIKSIDIQVVSSFDSVQSPSDVSIIGYACDEGVRRNQGRVGAKDGPPAIRSQLGRLAYHHFSTCVIDFGDIVCVDSNMEQSQADLANLVSHSIGQGAFPIVLGGGHEVAFGTFSGIWNATSERTRKIGIINFDAHFDLRSVIGAPNSGTPFNQILSNHPEHVSYLTLGIQRPSNTKSLFDIASHFGVKYVIASECVFSNLTSVFSKIDLLLKSVDDIYITIDMDGFASSFAPGVSAPSPMGFDIRFVQETLKYIFKSDKVVACDIAETNPTYDSDNMTAKLAARLVDNIVGLIK